MAILSQLVDQHERKHSQIEGKFKLLNDQLEPLRHHVLDSHERMDSLRERKSALIERRLALALAVKQKREHLTEQLEAYLDPNHQHVSEKEPEKIEYHDRTHSIESSFSPKNSHVHTWSGGRNIRMR